MAEDEKRSRPPPSIPSLLAGRPSASDERQSSRILASLEGRVPEAETKHLPPKQRSRTPVLALLLLLFLGFVGAGLWAVYDTAELPVVVARVENNAPPAAAPVAKAEAPAPAPENREPPPSSAATIIEEHPLAQLTRPDADVEPANPLAALAVTTPAPAPAAVPRANQAKAPAPRNAERGHEATAATAPAAVASAAPPKAGTTKSAPARGKTPPRNDSDAALLATLMAYGLPPASPPGTKVYKTDGVFVRELPGSPLSARLAECRKLGFLESEQCRLRVCAGHWGTAPECPNAQSHVEP